MGRRGNIAEYSTKGTRSMHGLGLNFCILIRLSVLCVMSSKMPTVQKSQCNKERATLEMNKSRCGNRQTQ